MQVHNYIAKVVILSSVLTVCTMVALGYLFRFELIGYVQSQIVMSNPLDSFDYPVSDSQRIVDAVQNANDAVVSVVATKDVPIYERYYETFNPWGFGSFAVPRVRENGTQEQEVGGGSGFFVNGEGMIVTNRHVVSDQEARYSVLLNDGQSYAVEILAVDAQLDVAILQISEPAQRPFPYLTFGDSESLQLGQTVIAIGNALAEFRNSVSVGVVSGLARSIVASNGFGEGEQLDLVIQTDAAINPGNSGGPLLNLDGSVIGVNVATSRGADNIGFALPAVLVAQVVDSVQEFGEIVRPYLGVRYTMIDQSVANENSLPVTYGALVLSGVSPEQPAIQPNSPASSAGLQEGDIILSIDGVDLRNRDLSTVLRSKAVGQTVELRVLQSETEVVILVTLEKAV